MTYDSLWKYRYWYDGYDFDLVMFYHGINDSRANNYPRDVFRDDYTQFSYYQRFQPAFDWIDRHPWLSRSFLVSWVMKLALFAFGGAGPLHASAIASSHAAASFRSRAGTPIDALASISR